MPIKILFCSKSYPIYGGVERWLSDLCEHLPKYDFHPVVALAQGSQFNDPSAYRAAYPHLHTVTMKSLTGSIMGRRIAAEKAIKSIKPDIVVPVMLHDALIAAISLKSSGEKYRIVYPIHELSPKPFKAVKDFVRDIDITLCTNRLTTKICQIISNAPNDRISHIYYGVSQPSNLQKRIRTYNGIIELGYCGRLFQPQKRVFDLSALCDELDKLKVRYRLSIAGSGPDREELEQSLSKYILSGKVFLTGQLTKEQLYDHFYPSLDALIITSTWETGPLVAWEAMIHGIPVVTSNYQGLMQEGILKDRENVLIFHIGNMAQAAGLIQELANDEILLQKLGTGAFETVQSNLTLDHMVSNWANLFKKVLDNTILSSGLIPAVPAGSGRLESWGLSPYVAENIRKILNKKFKYTTGQEEWPYYPNVEPEFVEMFDKALRELCAY